MRRGSAGFGRTVMASRSLTLALRAVGAERGDGFGGETLQPRVGVLERGAELRRGGIGARAERAEGFAAP